MAKKENQQEQPPVDPASVVQAVALLDCEVNGVRLKLGQLAEGPHGMVVAHAGMLDPHPDALARAQGAKVVNINPAPVVAEDKPKE